MLKGVVREWRSEDGAIVLYQGDCLEILPQLNASAIVTDPPYGVDFADWDGAIPNWLPVAQAAAPLVIFTTAPETQWSYPRPTWVLNWYRPASCSRSLLGGGFNHWSPVLVYGECKFPVDSINLHAIANAYPHGFWHPSPKPEPLMEWLVSPCGESIIDPFAGSFTTAVACIRMGKRFVGIEREPTYFDAGVKRVQDELARTALFEPTLTQRSLLE